MKLSRSQGKAVVAIEDWYNNRTEDQQVFRLFGYAGTGKTTIIEHVLGELGIDYEDIAFGSFTGKAAHVMRKNGLTGAGTIDSKFYIRPEHTIKDIEEEEELLKELRKEKAKAEIIAKQRRKIEHMKQPDRILNRDADAANASLIVLDEVSMVDTPMAEDLLSFGIPILVVGDPGQLPPIDGHGYFTQVRKPDIMLREIHRQALDSPIIRLATMARQGEHIEVGKYGKGVRKVEQINKAATYLKYDQVICGKNATRLNLNRMMRKEAGFKGPIPTGEDEKIICLRNDNECGLINGMFITLREIEPYGEHYIRCEIYDADTDVQFHPKSPLVYAGDFFDHHKFKNNRRSIDWKQVRGHNQATYGWAITCHKAQGSQWGKVMVIDEAWGKPKFKRQWLYTAITRAEERLTLVGD